MVKCRICIDECGESKDFDLLNFHLFKKHDTVPQEYKDRYPLAELCSDKYKERCRNTLEKTRRKHPDLYERSREWVNQHPNLYEESIEPTIDNIEKLEYRVRWLGLRLGSGELKGKEYRSTYHEYMEAKLVLESLVEKYLRISV